MDSAIGLVMTGGGARGAYQAGVLKRIGEIKRVQLQGNPFPIIGSSSAGAVNGSALAAGSHDFTSATKVLARLWSDLEPSDILTVMFYRRPVTLLPGYWISPLEKFLEEATPDRYWTRLL